MGLQLSFKLFSEPAFHWHLIFLALPRASNNRLIRCGWCWIQISCLHTSVSPYLAPSSFFLFHGFNEVAIEHSPGNLKAIGVFLPRECEVCNKHYPCSLLLTKSKDLGTQGPEIALIGETRSDPQIQK